MQWRMHVPQVPRVPQGIVLYCRAMNSRSQIEVNLRVALITEGAQVIAYTPALDISTVGKDEAEAKAHFGEMVRIFFNDLVENNTVDAVLTDLGWRKVNERWSPPVVAQESISVEVPAFA
jgi:hypothetical protein